MWKLISPRRKGRKARQGEWDLIVEGKVIIELKCVERLNDSHKKQLLTYLRQSDKKLGYLLNFGESLMKHGIVRIANHLSET